DSAGDPSALWFTWARRGWSASRADRYPRGKGARPLYAYWDGEKLGYIEARKRIYIPLYAQAVLRTPQFRELCRRAENEHLALFDFDGYRHEGFGMTLAEVVECPEKTMGHAFVLKLLVECGGRYDIDRMIEEGMLVRTGSKPVNEPAQLRML